MVNAFSDIPSVKTAKGVKMRLRHSGKSLTAKDSPASVLVAHSSSLHHCLHKYESSEVKHLWLLTTSTSDFGKTFVKEDSLLKCWRGSSPKLLLLLEMVLNWFCENMVTDPVQCLTLFKMYLQWMFDHISIFVEDLSAERLRK